MEKKDKKIIYDQLIRFTNMAEMNKEALIGSKEFFKLGPKEILEYASAYRDRCSEIFNKKSKSKDQRKFYLELPNIDLAGIDLSNFYLHDFMPGYAFEKSDGKKVFVTTKINLKDTRCVINMGTIRPIIISLDRKNN